MSFFAAFFDNGMALPNQGWTLQESKTDFFNFTSCRYNVETKLYSCELSKKSKNRKGNLSAQNFCTMARGISTQKAIYTCALNKYSIDVWFDLFYLFCGYQQKYGDISFFVKYPLFLNISQLSGSRNEVSYTIDRWDGNSIMPKSLEAKTGLLFVAEGEEPFSTITNLCILLFIFWPSKSA